MDIIAGKRQSGKSTELVRRSATTGYTILVHSLAMAMESKSLAKKLGSTIPEPMSWQQVKNRGLYGKNIKGFLIDESGPLIEDLLRMWLQTNGGSFEAVIDTIVLTPTKVLEPVTHISV